MYIRYIINLMQLSNLFKISFSERYYPLLFTLHLSLLYISIFIIKIIIIFRNMPQTKYNLKLRKAIQSIENNKYLSSQSWTDSITQFQEFLTVKNKQSHYFKIIQFAAHYTYIEESHQKINFFLNNYILNVQVKLIEREFQKNLYLLKGQKNCIRLDQYLKIKIENNQEIDQRFIMNLLNFFLELIKILAEHKINTDLVLQNICIQDDDMKLCDYEMFFHPKNMKYKDSNILKQKYIEEVKLIIYQLLSLKKVSTLTIKDRTSFLKVLKSKESKIYSQMFVRIICIIFNKAYIPQKLLRQENRRLIFQYGQYKQDVLTNSTVSLKDSFNSSTEKSDGSISSALGQIKAKKKFSKKRACIIAFIIFFFVAAMGIIISKFLLSDLECKSNQFKSNKKCYPCFHGCTSCLGQSNNDCTKCWGEYWLVVLNYSEKSGSCSQICVGIEFQGHRCIINSNKV